MRKNKWFGSCWLTVCELKNKYMKVNFKLILGTIFFILLIWSLVGCKAVEKYKASSAFPGDCADSFPVRIDTTFIEGKAVYDTVFSYDLQTITDTVVNEQETVIYRDIIKTVTVRRTDTIKLTKENTARVDQLNREKDMYAKQITQLNEDLAESETKRKRNAKHRNWLIALVVGFTLFSFRHQIIKMFV